MAEKTITPIAAIKQYFDHPTVTMQELRELKKADRDELAEGAAAQLGMKLEVKTA